jgi:26S proteasome regulatory subunit N10
MSMGGSTPEILTTLTTDIGKILDGLHRTKIKGSSHFVTGINVAAVCRARKRKPRRANKTPVGTQAQAEQVAKAADNHLQL